MNYTDFSGPYLDMTRKMAEPFLRVGEVAQKNAARLSDLMIENTRKVLENTQQGFSLLQKAHSIEDMAKTQIEYASKLGSENLQQGQKVLEALTVGAEELRRALAQEATEIVKQTQGQKKN